MKLSKHVSSRGLLAHSDSSDRKTLERERTQESQLQQQQQQQGEGRDGRGSTSLLYPEEFDNILSSMIDEEYIVSVTGIKDISRIEYISLQVDTNQQSILDLPDLLPNLKHLVLDNSTITSIRDLGVGLRYITSLSLSGCGLHDIDGIGVLTGLQELCLTDNHITDISPLTMHENLQNLNLSGNKIADISFGVVLSSCPNLKSLFLTRNPIERAPQYRAVVSYMIHSLEMLDGSPLDSTAALKVTQSTLNDVTTALEAIEDEMDDEDRLENEIFASVNKESINNNSVQSNSRSGVGLSGSSDLLPDTGSELTHGSSIVLAGNVAAAMRRRRNQQSSNDNKSESKSTDRRRGESKTFESTLDVLDSALADHPNAADEKEKMFKEGDITDSVLGSSTPAKGRFKTELSLEGLSSPTVHRPGPFSLDEQPSGFMSATKRPKSAFTGTTYRYANASNPSSPEKKVIEQVPNGKVYAASPRQNNSSRPQSAVNSGLMGSLSLPFNIAAETNGVAYRPPSKKYDSRDSDDEDAAEAIRARKIVGLRNGIDGSPVLNKGKSASIVHLDIVRRTIKQDLGKLEDIEDQPGGNDSDAEEIAITHTERLRMMSSSGSNTTSQMHKTRQNVLLKLQSKPVDDNEEDLQPPPLPLSRKISGSSLGSDKVSPRTAMPGTNTSSTSSVGTASKAGISLGFNLAGSLAAIDQWVHDMSSDEERSDDENDKADSTSSRSRGGSQISADFVIEAPLMTPRTALSNSGNIGGLKDKILSRDAIFHMCSNSSSSDNRRSQRELDPLPGSTSSRRDSKNSILSYEDSEEIGRIATARSSTTSTSTSIPHKTVQISAQKAALISKVTSNGTKVAPIQPMTEISFVVEEEKISRSSRDSSSSSSKSLQQRAIHLSDNELVDMLKQPPKAIAVLRTKASFQDFFRGIEAHRFRKLLQMAYDDISDKSDRESKIKRRMELMGDVFA